MNKFLVELSGVKDFSKLFLHYEPLHNLILIRKLPENCQKIARKLPAIYYSIRYKHGFGLV